MTVFTTSTPVLTGNTRYAMRGLLWWRRPVLQVEEVFVITATETVTFSSMETVCYRWKFATPADLKNLEILENIK